MKKMIIIPTVLVGMIGGYIFAQSDVTTSAEKAPSITAQQAKEIALKEFGGNIIDFEYDRDDNVPHYEIDIKNGNEKIELYIDATTGKVTVQEREAISSEKAPAITAQQAKEIALKEFGGNIIDFEYDRDDNVPHYEIDIKNGNEKIELYIDATTGKVTVKERKTISSEKAPTITAQQAKKIALNQFGGNIIDFEYDSDDNMPHYEIDIKNGNEKIELYIDATTGKVTVTKREVYNKNSNAQGNTTNNTTSKEQTAKILTEKEAIAIAQNKAKGTVTKVELDEDDDILIYEIEIENGNTEYEFEIHATTGKILKFESDRDDD
ncbi:PepSY domain-containing protein [Solibacillus sp. CAU 1738]|uniref:PepSY domain-containing protein n=1 Tax=Solibacillus sp. CAU 1738 TaxID=3140363 RepID=UPI0032611DA8